MLLTLQIKGLKKLLFGQAYPGESYESPVLLQRFLTGLQGSVSWQLLLKGHPEDLKKAIKEAAEVEYVLQFSNADVTEVHAIQQPTDADNGEDGPAIGKARSQVTPGTSSQWQRQAQLKKPAHGNCFCCGKEGHFHRECPLNCCEPAWRMPGGWQEELEHHPNPGAIDVNAILQAEGKIGTALCAFYLTQELQYQTSVAIWYQHQRCA